MPCVNVLELCRQTNERSPPCVCAYESVHKQNTFHDLKYFLRLFLKVVTLQSRRVGSAKPAGARGLRYLRGPILIKTINAISTWNTRATIPKNGRGPQKSRYGPASLLSIVCSIFSVDSVYRHMERL